MRRRKQNKRNKLCDHISDAVLDVHLRIDPDAKVAYVALEQQCKEIKQAVSHGKTDDDIGAGDQGLMFGYATDKTKECMPLTVTMECKECNGALETIRMHTLVISVNHALDILLQQIQNELMGKADAGLTGRKIIVDGWGTRGGAIICYWSYTLLPSQCSIMEHQTDLKKNCLKLSRKALIYTLELL
ncbi:hypothetical protein IHE44_0011280 [Lamprotornis superbus]|uniref:S-adenosylmethionine synthetase central domain-containing protein n=1 Tax=Lamprotornis superbus TaxID=245042 RepID=A0A835TRW9_9PASS|nr:hypothetical protein IHE44_0011280 [Lamprotornis superbus]